MAQPAAQIPQRILVVDEQSASRDLMVVVLGGLGYRVEAAGSLEQALALAGREAPALVIVSTTVNGPDGTSVLDWLQRTGNAPPTVLVGAASEPAPAGAAILARPVEIDQLLNVVKRFVDRPPPLAAGPPPSHEPVLDLDHLQSFTDGDPQLESELAALFLSSAGMYLERMAAALAAHQSWTPVAHGLKGASSNLGARRVAALARAAEHSVPSVGQLEALRAAIADVERLFAERPPR